MRTVEKRCETSTVMRPSSAPSSLARRRGVALEQRVLGLGVERGRRLVEHEEQRMVAHEPACERELLPLTERHLDAVVPRDAELRVEPACEPVDDVARARPVDRGLDRGPVVEPVEVAEPDGLAGAELEPEEVLERAGEPRRATPRPACARGRRRRP